MNTKQADLAGPGVSTYEEVARILPRDYGPLLTPRETMKALFGVKNYIEENLCRELNLMMVQVPLIVDRESGVNDMLDRIPGITVARGGGPGPRGGPGSGGGRGLGAGGDQILINGRRIAGKENEGGDQLSRIPSSQVDYIEIIRGTSGDLDVRGGTQVINIVLLESESSASYAYEINMDHLQDGTNRPGAKFSVTGQRGDLSYFLSAEREPRYEFFVKQLTTKM